MATPYIGEIRMFAGNFAPAGWALCNGQLLPIAQYDALYALIGTTYGGDGQTTFALPDLRGRAPIHVGPNYVRGAQVGSETVTLTQGQMPAHTHLAAALTGVGSANNPTGHVWAGSSTSDNKYIDTINSPATLGPVALQNAGGNQPHNNMQPYLVINFIIALEGIYPTPN
jgi:microcystin-dependent protein